MNKIKKTEFDNFTDGLYDVIFQETANYLRDCIGSEGWAEELHNAHGIIMFNAVAKIAKDMGLKQHFNDEYGLLRKAYKLIPDGTSHKDLIEIKQVLFSNDH